VKQRGKTKALFFEFWHDDDFEATKTSIDLKTRSAWVLASTPQKQNIFPEAETNDDFAYGYNRAKLAWYVIDPLFLRSNATTPDYIKNDKDLQSNHLVREVYEQGQTSNAPSHWDKHPRHLDVAI